MLGRTAGVGGTSLVRLSGRAGFSWPPYGAARWRIVTESGKKMNTPIVCPPVLEPHFPIGFYAQQWNLSEDTVRRWFQDHPGVMKVGESKRGKRSRIELRIPLSVANALYREKTK